MVLLFFVLIGLTRAQTPGLSGDGKQKEWIAQLTGHQPLNKDGFRLTGRSTGKDREKAAAYLVEVFRELGLQPEEHHYRMPNVHFLVDLLFAPMTGRNVYTENPRHNSW